jgi:magnesium transporter
LIRTILFETAAQRITSGGEELVQHWQNNLQSLIWLDIGEHDADEVRRLLEEAFGIHPLAVNDALRERHPPKFEAFDAYTFLLFKGLSADSRDVDCTTIQMALFVGARFLITRHSGESPSTEQLRDETLGDSQRVAVGGPAALALRLMRIMIDRYLNVLLVLEPRLEQLEQELLTAPCDEMLAELGGYKSELKKLRRIFTYHQQVLMDLRSNSLPGFSAGLEHEITDVFEHQERANSLATLYYELAADLIDSYISIASHRLNQVMKVLTIITAVFVPLSFLAGIYGMNFENMPELHSPSGYFILLGVMAGIALLLLFVFRKMRWL